MNRAERLQPKTVPPRGRHLLPLGRKAFLDYNPLPDSPQLYRTLRWGKSALAASTSAGPSAPSVDASGHPDVVA